MNALKLH